MIMKKWTMEKLLDGWMDQTSKQWWSCSCEKRDECIRSKDQWMDGWMEILRSLQLSQTVVGYSSKIHPYALIHQCFNCTKTISRQMTCSNSNTQGSNKIVAHFLIKGLRMWNHGAHINIISSDAPSCFALQASQLPVYHCDVTKLLV